MAREVMLNVYEYFRERISKKLNGSNSKREISKNNMKNKNKTTRLSKAAREFNVSTGTIVSFLTKKGYDIASNPNAKVTPEMYDLLIQEYSQEKSVKEEARKHSLKYTKKRSISLEDKKEDDDEQELEEEESDEFEDTILLKNTSLSSSTPTNISEEETTTEQQQEEEKKEEKEEAAPQQPEAKKQAPEESKEQKDQPEEKQEEPKPKEEQPAQQKKPEKKGEPEKEKEESGPKVLGKIDLESIEPKTGEKKPEKKKAKPKQEKPAKKEDKKAVTKEGDKAKETPAARKEEKAAEKQTEKPAAKEKKTPAKKSAEKKQEEQPGKTQQKKDIEKEKAKPEQKKPAEEEKKAQEKAAPQKEEKKAADKPAAEVPESKQESAAEKPAKETEAKKEDNFLKTKVEKLDGPKILGTIDLPQDSKKTDKKKQEQRKNERKKKKGAAPDKKAGKEQGQEQGKRKPVASSKDDAITQKKKRRKRIKPEQGGEQRGQGAAEGRTPQKHKGKPTKKTPRKGKARPQRHEPSEEEVQKQLKETMARLSGSGKKKGPKHRRNKREAIKQKEQVQSEEDKQTIKVTEFVTVNELASMMDANVNEVISTCMSLGLFVSINQRLDAETINLVADEFGYKVEFVSVEVQEALEEQEAEEAEDSEDELEPRAPIITVMGHVDHGKTSLLDYIRQENVIGGEAGGITQHIGAYEVETKSGKKITFLDTPGHEAFTAMRARGAQVTDIAIIIIAADDQIMPQTVEAINHAQAAGVPIVFAINKIDKPGASADKIREQLSHRNILVEDWGGKYQAQEISAKKGDGVDDLLEKVMLEAELLELKGNPSKKARGAVIESSLDKGRGYIAKLLVQDGTLKKGDYVLAGAHSGKVKAMYNELNKQIDDAGPSSPLLMLGLDGAPQAGDQFNVFDDEREAKDLANKRRQLQREQGIRTQKHITLDEIGRRIAIGDFKELNIIVKGDVDGSVEALSDALLKLSNEEVQVNVIHKSVGQISESDIMLATASEAIIVGFQVRPSPNARRLAEKEQIDIRTYSVIYQAIEEIKAAIEGMLSPDIEEKVVGNIEVRDTFKISKVGTVAGCKVLDGKVTRNTKIRVIRDGIVIYTGNLGSLKRYKDDVKEVKAGYECGLNIESFNDIKVGDIIEGFEEVEVQRKLDSDKNNNRNKG